MIKTALLSVVDRVDRAPRATQISTLRRFTIATSALTFLLVVSGNIVRITDSGLGCPDWPLCFGQVIPIPDAKAIIEVAHRAFALFVSIFIVATALLNFRWNLDATIKRLSLITIILLGVQIFLGAITVWSLLHPISVAAHLAAGMGVLGCMVGMAYQLALGHSSERSSIIENSAQAVRLRKSLVALATAIYILLVTGGLVSGYGAALACGMSYPLCNGGLLPNGGSLVFVQWLHRAVGLVVALLLIANLRKLFAKGVEMDSRIRLAALALVVAFVVQGTFGALMVLFQRPAILATLHNATGAAVWVCALSLAILSNRLRLIAPEKSQAPLPLWKQTINDYVALTKPRVISLLLFTTFAAMFITPAGAPPWYLVVWTMIGGYLMAGGANAVNMAYDFDIDHKMGRTSKRPVPSGRITRTRAYVFGFALMALSLAVFILYVNWLAALLSAVGFFYYTAIYTRWLKRNTWQNIVIGGGAGAIPPLIGWAAASSELTWSSLMLFAIIFYWTPPHFWALAIMKKNDYAAANVPMLPVVAGDKETAKQIVIYTVGMIALTLVLVPLQMMGNVYLLGAAGLGCVFLWRAWQVYKDQSRPVALKLYTFSLLYLALLFLIMMIDRLSMS